MANREKITELIDEAALKQWEDLIKILSQSQVEMSKNIDLATKLNAAMSKTTTMGSFVEEQKKAAAAIEQVGKSNDKTRIQEIQLQRAREQNIDRYNKKLAQQQSIEAKKLARAKELSRAYRQLSASLEDARKRAQDIGVAMGVTSKEFREAAKEVNTLDRRIKQIDKSLGLNQRNVGNYGSAFGGVISNLQSIVLSYISVQGLMTAGQQAFTQSLESDAVRTSLEFTLGSVDLADSKLDQLLHTANKLGINFNSLASGYKSFIGGVKASNFDFEQGERIFNAVAVASSRLKLSADDTEGALRALQQMISKGNVQAEELRGQLGERIPGAFAIAARAMNVTETELNKLLEGGDVLASELLPKLAIELEKTFDAKNIDNVNGLSAAWERLKNVFSGAVSEGTLLRDMFTQFISGAANISAQIIGLVRSSSWKEFWARMINFQEGESIKAIEDSMERIGKAIDRSSEIDIANASYKELETTYQNLKVAQDLATASLDEYRKKIEHGDFTEDAKHNVKELTDQLGVLSARMLQIKRFMPENAAPLSDDARARIDAKNAEKAEKARLKAERDAERARAKAEREAEAARKKEEKRIASELALVTFRAQTIADLAKQEAENTSLSYSDRIEASELWLEQQEKLLAAERDQAKQAADFPAERIKAEEEYTAKLADLKRHQGAIIGKSFEDELNNIKLRMSEEDTLRIEQAAKETESLKKAEEASISALTDRFLNGEIKEKEFQQKKLDLQSLYSQLYIQQEIDEAERLIEVNKSRGIETGQAERDLAALRLKLSKEVTDKQIEDAEKLLEREKEINAARAELAQEVANLAFGLIDARFERQQQEVEDQIKALDSQTQAEINAVNQSTLTEEQKTIRIAQIEAKAQVQREQLEARQRQIQLKQAKFDRAANIAGIVGNTARGVTSALAMFPPNIPLSILIGAIGAAQIATVLAQPLPRFFKGTDSSPEGFAHVGEKGTELMVDPRGKLILTPPRDTVTYLQKGTQIFDAAKTKNILAGAYMHEAKEMGTFVSYNIDVDKVVKATKDSTKELKEAFNKRPEHRTILTKSGLRSVVTRGNKWIDYKNRNIR